MNGPRTILGGIDFGGAGADAVMWASMHFDPERVILRHVLLGTVAQAVARNAACPVLLLPAKDS